MHYWLLAGRHGAAIRRLGWPDGLYSVWRARLQYFEPSSRSRCRSSAWQLWPG
jgi:hypothetical protein